MPYESEKQRKFMYAKHPEIAKRYEREGKNKVVPSKAKGAQKRTSKRGKK